MHALLLRILLLYLIVAGCVRLRSEADSHASTLVAARDALETSPQIQREGTVRIVVSPERPPLSLGDLAMFVAKSEALPRDSLERAWYRLDRERDSAAVDVRRFRMPGHRRNPTHVVYFNVPRGEFVVANLFAWGGHLLPYEKQVACAASSLNVLLRRAEDGRFTVVGVFPEVYEYCCREQDCRP